VEALPFSTQTWYSIPDSHSGVLRVSLKTLSDYSRAIKLQILSKKGSSQTVPSPPLDPQVDNGSLVSGWPGSANTATLRVDENEFQYYLPIGHIGIPDFV